MEAEVEDDFDNDGDDENDSGTDDEPEHKPDAQPSSVMQGKLSIDRQRNEIAIDFDGQKIFTKDWLVLASREDLQTLRTRGYDVINSRPLDALDLILASLQAPASFDLEKEGHRLLTSLNTDDIAVDFNHIYGLADATANASRASANSSIVPFQAMPLPADAIVQPIGVIDTSVRLEHNLLKHANIEQKSFITRQQQPTWQHGTAIASVFAAKGITYRGLVPNAAIYSAAVFFRHPDAGQITTVAYMTEALNWLAAKNVGVVNMSLAGPPNQLLQKVVTSICEKGIKIVAAVGNSGPSSPAQFPAGYSCTVGVTAVDYQQRVYRRAVRGRHVDIAAYGVNLMHASDQGLSSSSGTSMAAPFVSAYLAAFAPQSRKDYEQWLNNLYANTIDLGEPGQDDVYGHGLLPPYEVNKE